MTIQAAIVSQDTFALDSRNHYLPGLITYEAGPGGGFVLTITPIGSADLDLGIVEVIIGSADLQALRAMRDQDKPHVPPTDPSNPSNPSDAPCYDCRTNQTRLDTLDSEYATLTQALDVIRIYQRMHGQRITDIERRLRQVMGLLDALVDEMHAPAMTNPDAPLEVHDATPTHP